MSPKTKKTDQSENCKLVAFRRVHVPAGQTKTVSVSLDNTAFSYKDAKGDLQLTTGEYTIIAGLSSPFKRNLDLGAANWKSTHVNVR